MFRRLCGRVKCNASPPKRTRINNVKNYLLNFDPNSIKVINNRGFSPNKRLITVIMYVNGRKSGNAAIEIGPNNANFNWGRTEKNFQGQQVGRILRALLTKAVINAGKYNKITHHGSNLNKLVRPNNKNRRPISTRILQNKLGFRPNPVSPTTRSNFSRGNSISRINKTLNNYKKGLIGPQSRNSKA